MRTTSVMLQNLCVPCSCHCRYCLLSWSGKMLGVDYQRSEDYARRFYLWIKENRPDVAFNFSFGYSMDHPDLFHAIDFMRSIGSVGSKVLQFDGMKFRSEPELENLIAGLKEHGVEHLNFTFYGLQAYHDRFAGRKGDFGYMIHTISLALAHQMKVSAGFPLSHESVCQVDELIATLKRIGVEQITLFVPHEEGRGVSLNPIRFSKPDLCLMSEASKKMFNQDIYKTEADWVTSKQFDTTDNRVLIISLMPDNINKFEQMGFEEVITYVEDLDETYYSIVPALEELVELYGDSEGEMFYRQRDLYHHYQKRYIQEHGLDLYDVTDERQCGSRRY